MIPKSWIQSTTLWTNVAIAVIAGLIQIAQALTEFMSPDVNVILLAAVGYMTQALNILMRFKTSRPIVAAMPAKAAEMRVYED